MCVPSERPQRNRKLQLRRDKCRMLILATNYGGELCVTFCATAPPLHSRLVHKIGKQVFAFWGGPLISVCLEPKCEINLLRDRFGFSSFSVSTFNRTTSIHPIFCQHPITPILKLLHRLPIQQKIHFKILILVFKALHGSAP